MRRTFVAVLALLLMAARPVPAQTQAASPKAASVADRGVLLKQAADAQQKGDSAQAMRLFQLAADRYQSVRAYLELARLQSRSKETAAALATLTKAREFAPNSEDVLSAYAQLALASKQPMPAVLTLMPLARMYPKVAQYHYLLGVGLMAVGDMPAAVDALEEANRLDPDRALTLLALGLSFNNRKLFAEAKTALVRSLELQPDSNEAAAALAEAEAGLGELDGAMTHARQVLERAPSNATANLVVGLVALERRSYAEARDALVNANKADPDSPKVLYQLSLVFARLGDDPSARRYLDLYQEKLRSVEERISALRTGGTLTPGASRR
ncbi:MAG: tetratricopeptide repeat protein [Vicinamibacterales bacterium]